LCVLLTTSVVQKDYTRMLKDYVKRFAESIGRFFSEDQLGTSTLEAGKSALTVLESGKLSRERAEVWLGKLIKRLLDKANSAPKSGHLKPAK
uniref:Flavodoxin n=1 Tax=Taenia asiatica TaxID=60517 RepID=A0A0R3VSL8_TAEAS